jgi:hypothetical protein
VRNVILGASLTMSLIGAVRLGNLNARTGSCSGSNCLTRSWLSVKDGTAKTDLVKLSCSRS